MIAEAAASLGPDKKPGAVVISVGGGGLLCGVVQGLQDVGWTDVPIIAMETDGANCFNAAVKAGRLVTLDDITRWEFKRSWNVISGKRTELIFLFLHSEAKCLGAKTVCQKAFEQSQRKDLNIISELVTDQQALHAVQTFLGLYGGAFQLLWQNKKLLLDLTALCACDLSDEERVLVEMACGAALAAVYSGVIRKLQDESKHDM